MECQRKICRKLLSIVEVNDSMLKPIKNMRLEINLDDDVITSLLMPFYYSLGIYHCLAFTLLYCQVLTYRFRML